MDVPFSFSSPWPYGPTITHLGLALALGVFVGLERENRGKEAGVRTFGFASLLGCLGGLLGQTYALLALSLLGVLVVFLNLQRLQARGSAELTTSVALLVIGFTGVLCGLGHTFAPVAVAVITAALLAWKEPLAGFSVGLTEEEIRSAILLAILTFIIYPILPKGSIDPWHLLEPRVAWETVILVAGVGFVNYVLWKIYGTRGVALTGFLGGLVNSTVVVTELAARVGRAGAGLIEVAYRSILLATAAMLLRNTILLGALSPRVLALAASPLAIMFAVCVGVVFYHLQMEHREAKNGAQDEESAETTPVLHLTSPFSLTSALKFGALFVVIDIAGSVGRHYLGTFGFYAISFIGGLASSASAVASAATLASHNRIGWQEAANGAVLASLASILVNLPLIARLAQQKTLTLRLGLVLGTVIVLGGVAIVIQPLWLPYLQQLGDSGQPSVLSNSAG